VIFCYFQDKAWVSLCSRVSTWSSVYTFEQTECMPTGATLPFENTAARLIDKLTIYVRFTESKYERNV